MKKCPDLYPAAEGVTACTRQKSATAVRLENGRLALSVRGGLKKPLAAFPVLRGMARFWQSLYMAAASVLYGAKPQTRVRAYGFEETVARSLGVPSVSVAACFSALHAAAAAFVYLYALPYAASVLVRPALLCACLRTAFAMLMLYRLSRIRFVRRLSMYRGAAYKYANARLKEEDPGYEAVMSSPRLYADGDAPFDAAAFAIAVFTASVLGDWYASVPAAALVRLAALTLAAGLLDEVRRIVPCGGLFLQLAKLVTLEPRLEMTETVKVAASAAEAQDDAG